MASNQAGKKSETSDCYENPNISSRTKHFYLNTDSADVYFICVDRGNDVRIPAHKVIMSMASDAFDAMFHGELRERGDVKIGDASTDGFKEFLKFFYFDKIKLSMKHIEDVVYLCAKYILTSNIGICERFLLDSLNIENVCLCYGLAITYDLIELKQKCKGIITQKTLDVFQTLGFLKCDRSVLAAILKFETLSCIEIDLFKWCMAWVKAAGNGEKLSRKLVDEQLGDSFRDIRFGSMTEEHLAQLLPEYSDIFEVEEHQEIHQLIVSKDFHSVLFKGEPRPIPWNDADYINMEVNTIGHNLTSMPSKTLLLGRIIFKTTGNQNKTSADLMILRKPRFGDDRKTQFVFRQEIEPKASHFGFFVTLHKPFIFSPNFNYLIRLVPKIRSTAIEGKIIKDQNLSDIIVGFWFVSLKEISSKDYRL